MKPALKTLCYLLLFSIAMGFMESAVVVYLRALYYPDGFAFPLVPLGERILLTELLRELATLIMLLVIGILAGKNFPQRFAYFLFCFAIWDLFYYLFLYLLIGWPVTLLDPDILFLLPVPWIGPVIAPCLLSLLMIAFAFLIVWLGENRYMVKFRLLDWLLLASGSVTVVFSFTKDYLIIPASLSEDEIMEYFSKFVPVRYDWAVFVVGFLMIVSGILMVFLRSRKQGKSPEFTYSDSTNVP